MGKKKKKVSVLNMDNLVFAFLLNRLEANEEIRLSTINYRQLGMMISKD